MTEDCSDIIDDIRLTTILHHADSMLNSNKMSHIERIAVGTHVLAGVVRNMPEAEQMKWLSFVIHSLCSQSASLSAASFFRDQAVMLPAKQVR